MVPSLSIYNGRPSVIQQQQNDSDQYEWNIENGISENLFILLNIN